MTPFAYMMAGAIAFAETLAAGPVEAMDQCVDCRAIAHFRTCDKPIEGKRVFQGRATRVEEFGCSQLLSLDVVAPAGADLPPRIQVALGACAIWAGQNGEVIDIAVEEPHSRQNGLYTLACRHW